MKVSFIITSVLVMFGLGFLAGTSWESLKNYDAYVYRFSQYSSHLRSLVEHQQIEQLTNTVLLFDNRFNASKDPAALQDVMLQILKLGKYYTETNAPTTVK